MKDVLGRRLDARETKWGTVTQALFDYDVSGSGRDNLGRVREVRKTGAMFNRYGTGGAGVQTSYNYNDRSELTVEQTKLGGTSTLLTGRDDTYSYDHLGNRKTRSHNGTSFTWQVNELNQYVAETIPGVFDVAGAAAANATVTVNGSASGVTRHGEYYFKGHPLNNSASTVFANLSVSDGTSTATVPAFVSGTPRGFAYDEDGNLRDDGRWVYVYDAENRLFWMETSGAAFNAGVPRQALQFAYDYLGRRVSKATFTWSGTAWVAQSTRRFLWRDWDLVAELDGAGATVVRHYAWGLDVTGSLTAAGGVGGLLLVQEAGQSYLPVYDALGNVHGLLRASDGQLVAAYEYDAFGNTIRESGAYAANNPFRFSTKFTDLETALVYYGLRYYGPSLGRFINRDPIEEKGGMNLYAFCRNNGVNAWDYLGMDPLSEWMEENGIVPTASDVQTPTGGWGPNVVSFDSWVGHDDMEYDPRTGSWAPSGSIMRDNIDFISGALTSLGYATGLFKGKTAFELVGSAGVVGPTVAGNGGNGSRKPVSISFGPMILEGDAGWTKASEEEKLQPIAPYEPVRLGLAHPRDLDPIGWANAVMDARIAAHARANANRLPLDPGRQSLLDALATTSAGIEGAVNGTLAGIDGLLPLFDPFASAGAYNPADPSYRASQAVGRLTQSVVIARGVGAAYNAGMRSVVGGSTWETLSAGEQALIRIGAPLVLVYQQAGVLGLTSVLTTAGFYVNNTHTTVSSEINTIVTSFREPPPRR